MRAFHNSSHFVITYHTYSLAQAVEFANQAYSPATTQP